jgi:hypothetical protein
MLLLTAASLGIADDQKPKSEPKKPEPPVVIVALPLAVTAGTTNKIVVRGLNLTNTTELRMTNSVAQPKISIKSRAKIDVPKEQDAKKVGDTQLELEVTFRNESAASSNSCSCLTNYFVIITPDGQSDPQPLLLFPPGSLIDEKEPNGSFRQAQAIETGKTIRGAIKEATDVDVFRFEGKTGEQVIARVSADCFGSILDSILTLYDDQGHIVVTADDTEAKRDSTLRAKLPATGTYYLSLIDAHDKGGPTHVYLLSISRDN